MPESKSAVATAPFEPHRFRSTVEHYVANRPRYPMSLLQLILNRIGHGEGARVLDLGCGPGFLAIGFAELGCVALGVDPSPDMLEAARAAAAEAKANVTFRKGSSYDLEVLPGPFDLCVMGRSFHWMDRAATVRTLERLIAPGGAIALLTDAHIPCEENAHDRALKEVREFFGEPDPFRVHRKSEAFTPDESILINSAFSHLERLAVIERRTIDTDAIVGRGLSLSNTSPEKLGDRLPAFEAELRRRLAKLSPSDKFTELIELTALVATRPAA